MKTTITLNRIFKTFFRLQRSSFSVVFLLLFTLSASSSWGQIAQRGSSTTASSATTNNTTITINKPTGVVAGDVLLFSVVQNENDNDNGGLSSPTLSGWTLVKDQLIRSEGTSNGDNAWFGSIYYRVSDGSEGTSFTFAMNSRCDMAIGSMVAFSGVACNALKPDGSANGPFDITPGSFNNADSSTATATGVTVANNNSAVIMFAMCNNDRSYSSWSNSQSELFDNITTNGDDASVGAAWLSSVNSGSTGNRTVTLSASDRNSAILLVLRRATTMTVGAASSTPTLCVNTALTNITHTTTGATGIGTSTGLPSGVTPTWASNTITISGTPTASGIFTYSIPLVGSCAPVNATGTITVTASPVVTASANTTTFCGSGTVNLTGTTDINTETSVVADEDFDNTSTYTASGGSTKTGTSGSGDRPASASFVVSPTTSYWVNNGTATITTQNFTGLQNGADKTVAMRLASFSIGSTSNGAEATDNVWVDISLDGGSTYSREIEVNGGASGSTHWGFSTGTGVASVTYDGNNTATVFAPTGSGARTTDGFSLLQITLPTSATQVRVRVRLFNNSGSEAWIIDDITVSQAIVPTYSWTSNPAGFTSALQNPTGVTVSASTTYTLTATNPANGCSGSGSVAITVTPNNTATAGSSTPTLCVNTALTNITHTTTGATGIGTATGLPTGVTPTWASNTITISGTPTASGTFNYTIPLTGGCGSVNATGTITVTAAPSAGTLSGTNTLCSDGSTSLSSTISGGAWSSSNEAVATINSSTGLVSGFSAGTATMTYTVTSNGCSGSETRAVTINTSPNITGQPANQSVTTAQTATFTVTATGTSLTYQWQEYAGSIWANISNGGVYSGATTASLSIASPTILLNGYKYRCEVSGTCSPTATSDGNATLAVTLNYCSPTFTSGVEPITNVTFNTINNSSASTCNAGTSLENFINQSTTVIVQQSYTLSVSGTTCGNYTNFIRAYFDWNGDGDFLDAGESYDLGTITNTVNGFKNLSITIPETASLGETRMRIMKRYNGYPTGPCQTGSGFGQAEDYAVIICANPTISSPTANATVTKCSGENTSFSVTASSPTGAGATTYQWQVNTGASYTNISDTGVYSGSTTATLSLTGVTTTYNNYLYRCVVSSGCGGSATSVVTTLIVNSLPVVTADPQVCIGSTITLSPTTGGTWTSSNANATVTNAGVVTGVTAGTAAFTFTNTTTGCSATTSSVTINALPVVNAGTAFTKTCVANTSGAAIGETAEAGHTYSWSPSTGLSSATASNPTANPSSTTTYTVTKTNTASGCTATGTVTVTVNNSAISVNAGTAFTKTCVANTSGAAIGETAEAGHTYSWSPSTGLSSAIASNPTANPTTTTTYTVTKTNTASGCTATGTVTVTVNNSAISVNAGTAFTKTCVANTSGAAIGETAEAGHTYSWSPSTGLSSATASNPTANPSSTTTYTVTKTNTASGCTATGTVIVTVNNTAISVNAGTAFTKTCVANTSGAAIGETAEAGHTYSWSPSTGLSSAIASNPTANPTTTTTYTVTKTNTASGCTATGTVTVTVNNSAISVNAGTAFTKTCVANTSGAAIGETAEAGHTYSWSPSTGLSSATASNPTANPTTTTTYTVTKTNTASGCTAAGTVIVTVNNSAISVNAGTAFTKTCVANTSGAAIGETAEAGHTYSWSPSTGLSSAIASNPTANPTTTTTYTVTKTNTASGCTATGTVIVTVDNQAPTVTVSANQSICAGSSVTLSGSGATSYSWNNGISNGVAFTPSATTTYTVTGTDANGCSNTASTTITVNPIVTPTFTEVAAICSGDTLAALPTTSTNGITGTWSPALDNTATTTYTFTPTAGQCASTATMTITVNPIVTPAFTQVAAICSGATLAALPTTSINGITGTWSPALDNTATTVYTFTPTAGQCASTATMTITVNPIVTPTFTQVAAICSGATLAALPTTSNNGITGTWSPALDNTATTTYTFTTTAGQCASTATMTITVNPIVTPTFTQVAAICSGDTLAALPTTSNNSITGTWSPAINNTATTMYTFTPTGGQCPSTTTMTITVNPVINPSVSIAASATTICSGTSVTFTATPTNGGASPSYQWKVNGNNVGTNSATYTSTTLANTDEVKVILTVNTTQCLPGSETSSNTVTMTVNPNLPASVSIAASPSAFICIGTSATFTATPTNGGATPSYQWKLNGNNVGTNSATYSSSTIANNDVVSVVMTSTATCVTGSPVTSNVITMTVSPLPCWTGSNNTSWNLPQNWAEGVVPTDQTAVFISGTAPNQPQVQNGTAYASSIELLNNAVLTIKVNASLVVTNGITVPSTAQFIVENNANFVQINPNAVNSGSIKVKRNTRVLQRLDYVLWSSPTEGTQTLKQFSPQTVDNRFYTYNSATNLYDVMGNVQVPFQKGKGYLIRTPNNHPTTPTVWSAEFNGVPINGTITQQLPAPRAGNQNRYFLVGNPYASEINLMSFMQANEANINGIIYIWRKTNGTAISAYGSIKRNPNNSIQFTSNGNGGAQNPGNFIPSGQGFIVDMKEGASQVVFTNDMRVSDQFGVFNRTSQVTNNTIASDQFTLKLGRDNGEFTFADVGYFSNASNNYEPSYDVQSMSDAALSVASIVENKRIVSQSRAAFDTSHVVPLSIITNVAGNYKLSLDSIYGVFADNQIVYLRDNLMNTIHNLTEGSYSFASQIGTFDSRFEIIYQLPLAISTPVVTSIVGSYTYNGSPQGPNAATNTGIGTSYTFIYEGTGSTIYAASSIAPTNAGTYTVTATVEATGNYASASSSATAFAITAKPLTITALDHSKCVGVNYVLPSNGYSIEGLVGSQSIDNVTLSSTGNPSNSVVGTYPIVAQNATGGTFSNSNYSITYIDGTLTVDPLSVGGTASASSTSVVSGNSTTITLTDYTGAIQWQSSNDGDSWTDEVGATQNTYTTPVLTQTVHYRALVTSGACFSVLSSSVVIAVDSAPLAVPTFNESQVVIYKTPTNEISINTGNVVMSMVKIFDIRGRLLQEQKDINATQTFMNAVLTTEVLLVQITSEEGVVVTKKVLFPRTSLKLDKNLKAKTQLAEDE